MISREGFAVIGFGLVLTAAYLLGQWLREIKNNHDVVWHEIE